MKDEQEQIEEMAKGLEEAKYLAIGTVGSMNNGFGGWYGSYMYKKGYRKASDVIDEFVERLRKEKLWFGNPAYPGDQHLVITLPELYQIADDLKAKLNEGTKSEDKQ